VRIVLCGLGFCAFSESILAAPFSCQESSDVCIGVIKADWYHFLIDFTGLKNVAKVVI